MATPQQTVPEALNVYEEWDDLRKTAAVALSLIYLGLGLFLLATSVNINWAKTGLAYNLRYVILIGSALGIISVRQTKPRLMLFLVLSTMWIFVGTQQVFVEYQAAFVPLMLFPVIIAVLFLKREAILQMAIFSIVLILGMDYQAHQSLLFSLESVITSGLSLIVGFCGFTMYGNAAETLQWAVDSQMKNYIRAEHFYEQGEALRKSLYELGRANERLQQLTQELDQARQSVEAASQAKSIFLSNMSHELRSPLNMIIGYTSSMLNMPQMYQNQRLPELFRRDVDLVLSSGQYLLTMINDILDLSKIEAGKFEVHPMAFDLVPTLNGVMASSIGLLKEKDLQLKPDYPELGLVIWADPLRIRQILLNLMSNAIKYTQTGSVTLSAKIIRDRLRIAVIDTGVGIPQETISYIFDRFEQAPQDSHIQGTGLGLDISQRLAQLHGAEIKIESTVGIGSSFAFELQLATPEQIAEQAQIEKPSQMTGVKRFERNTAAWEMRYTVLIIENDSDRRSFLMHLFEIENFLVFGAQNAAQGLEVASALLPHLIIVDGLIAQADNWAFLADVQAQPELVENDIFILSESAELLPETFSKTYVCIEKSWNPDAIIKLSKERLAQRISLNLVSIN